MINFEDFEVAAEEQLASAQTPSEQACEPVSTEVLLTPQQTSHSLHDTNIEEIDDHYSSFEHSANILDQVYRSQLSFGDNDCEPVPREDSEEVRLRRRLERRMKNETKNIPKNFGKGIISFIEKNDLKVRALLARNGVNYQEFVGRMRSEKKIINTIADLRRLWTDPVVGRCMRVISNIFFRRHALNYIFNSRISNYSSHVKYRQSLWQALRSPHSFNRIK
jgi:hypothetical protein